MKLFFTTALVLGLAVSSQANVIRFLPFGDSITAGGYNENDQWKIGGGYREFFYKRLKEDNRYFDVVGSLADGPQNMDRDHEGHSGWSIAQLDAIAEEVIKRHNPEVVMLMIGTNNIVKNMNLPQAPQRLLALVRKLSALKPSMRIIVSSLLTTDDVIFNRRVVNFNAAIDALIHEEMKTNANLFWFDAYWESGIGANRVDLIDGVHPSAIGYQKLGNAWFKAIQPVLYQR